MCKIFEWKVFIIKYVKLLQYCIQIFKNIITDFKIESKKLYLKYTSPGNDK